jgi:hypothetical protein
MFELDQPVARMRRKSSFFQEKLFARMMPTSELSHQEVLPDSERRSPVCCRHRKAEKHLSDISIVGAFRHRM